MTPEFALTYDESILAGKAQAVCVLLARGTLESGAIGYAYVGMSCNKLGDFQAAVASGEPVNLAEFGEIILKGTGTPGPEQIEYMYMNWLFSHRKTVLRLLPAAA